MTPIKKKKKERKKERKERKKRKEKKRKLKQLTLHSFLISSEPRPGPSSTE